MRYLYLALASLLAGCSAVELPWSNILDDYQPLDQTGDVSLLSWNILAPMWVDRAELKARGVVDLNLLNDDVRLDLIAQRILDTKADIVTLQEVQEEVFVSLSKAISGVYNSVAFAPNEKEYWKSYLPEGVDYKKNGVATFYNKKRFSLVAHNTFETSDQGSIALASVLRPQRRRFVFGRFGHGEPIILINCHLETGVTPTQSYTRIVQGNAVMNEAKRISKGLSVKFPRAKPVVIIAGDLNTQNPFPGFTNFKAENYLDAFEDTGNPDTKTFYLEEAIPLLTGGVLDSSALDHVLIRSADKDSGRIRLISAGVPDIESDETKEETYIKKLTDVIASELRRSKHKQYQAIIGYLLKDPIFATLFGLSSDDSNTDANVNKVLRLGSDHLPVLVKFEVKM